MDELMPILNEIKSTMLSVINMQTITLIITNILGACVLLYVGWFAIKSIVNSLKSALNGNLMIDINSRRARKWYKKEGYKYYSSYDDYVNEYNSRHGAEDGFIK